MAIFESYILKSYRDYFYNAFMALGKGQRTCFYTNFTCSTKKIVSTLGCTVHI